MPCIGKVRSILDGMKGHGKEHGETYIIVRARCIVLRTPRLHILGEGVRRTMQYAFTRKNYSSAFDLSFEIKIEDSDEMLDTNILCLEHSWNTTSLIFRF